MQGFFNGVFFHCGIATYTQVKDLCTSSTTDFKQVKLKVILNCYYF